MYFVEFLHWGHWYTHIIWPVVQPRHLYHGYKIIKPDSSKIFIQCLAAHSTKIATVLCSLKNAGEYLACVGLSIDESKSEYTSFRLKIHIRY